MSKSIKAIGFDIGGVILPYSIREQKKFIATAINVDIDKVFAAYKTYLPELEIGALGTEEFWRDIIEYTGSTADPKATMGVWTDHYIRDNPIVTEIIDLVDSLGRRGYNTGILSNIDSAHGIINLHRHIFEHFDRVLLSYQIGVRKPEPAAFRLLAESLAVEFEELVFVDDLPMNIEAANQLGIDGLLYTSFGQLIYDLKQRNIPLL